MYLDREERRRSRSCRCMHHWRKNVFRNFFVVGTSRSSSSSTGSSARVRDTVSMAATQYKSVLENTVGITEFANVSCVGFTGIIKQRYSDFIVREVSKSNRVAILNDHTLDSARSYEEKIFNAHHDNTADTIQGVDLYLADMKAAGVAFEDEDKLRSFLQDAIHSREEKREPKSHEYQDPAFEGLSKDARTVVHKGCKKYLPQTMVTDGFQVGGRPSIKISISTKAKGTKGDNNKRRRKEWPEGVPDNLKFVLIKENVDTMTAINAIGQHLKINPRNIAYCGTKDKRAVTAQWCSVYRRKPTDILRINRMRYPFIRVGNFEYCKDPLRLGQLHGNRFEIILRDISISAEEVTSSCAQLSKSGFINYFGLQRFGRIESKSHLMGLKIIKGDWQGVIDTLFSPNSEELSSLPSSSSPMDWKREYAQGNYKKAAELIPRDFFIEKLVIEWLADHPTDFLGAYNRSPKASRLICIHAYQSYIWNMAVSERLSLYGFKCIEGDLVTHMEQLVDDTDAGDEDDLAVEERHHSPSSINDMISVVKAEDVSKYDIRNVVLPLPGSKVMLPTNTMKNFYEELLARDGLTLESFGANTHFEYNSSGTYRKIVQSPIDFEYKVISYTDVNAELADTELLKIKHSNNNKQQQQQ